MAAGFPRRTNSTDTGRHQRRVGSTVLQPTSLHDLTRCLNPGVRVPFPLRPRGGGAGSTDCNTSSSGVVIDLTRLDRIIHIDTYDHTVTAQAGVRLRDLVAALAEQGLELGGCYDVLGRTLGGAVAAPCFGPGIGSEATCLSSHVIGLKLVTASGKVMSIAANQARLLHALRDSYGMLGVIFEVTLRVRPVVTFAVTHRRVPIDKFCSIVDTLATSSVGLKFYLMPYRNRVYVDLRRHCSDTGTAHGAPWKLKDWGESTVLPQVFKSLSRVVPLPSVRYRLIDGISEATKGLVNNRLVTNGTNAAAAAQRGNPACSRPARYSTWCFPAAEASIVIRAYAEFCRTTFARTRYRCDLPAVGYRIEKHAGSLLSPAHDETMIALQTSSTQARGWEDFVIDLAEFAEQWGGIPIFSQSRSVRADHAWQAYANRIDLFRGIRRKLDPENRLLNPFLAQYFQ